MSQQDNCSNNCQQLQRSISFFSFLSKEPFFHQPVLNYLLFSLQGWVFFFIPFQSIHFQKILREGVKKTVILRSSGGAIGFQCITPDVPWPVPLCSTTALLDPLGPYDEPKWMDQMDVPCDKSIPRSRKKAHCGMHWSLSLWYQHLCWRTAWHSRGCWSDRCTLEQDRGAQTRLRPTPAREIKSRLRFLHLYFLYLYFLYFLYCTFTSYTSCTCVLWLRLENEGFDLAIALATRGAGIAPTHIAPATDHWVCASICWLTQWLIG